jgi:hypothetical protein
VLNMLEYRIVFVEDEDVDDEDYIAVEYDD